MDQQDIDVGGSLAQPAVERPGRDTTIVVLLGASKYPRKQRWSERAVVLRRSADAVRDYVLSSSGLAVASDRLLDLFDARNSASAQLLRIAKFLRASGGARDLVLYYVGHGGFHGDHGDMYHLGVRRTMEGLEALTAIESRLLAYVIREAFRGKRAYVILDSCFAAAAGDDFQGDEAKAAVREMSQLLQRGIAVLAAASKDDVARAPEGDRYTKFTSAVLETLLESGVDSGGKWLSLYELYVKVHELLQACEGRPEVHLPSITDVSRVPLFPNPAHARAQAQAWVEAVKQALERARQKARLLAAERACREAIKLLETPPQSTVVRAAVLESSSGTRDLEWLHALCIEEREGVTLVQDDDAAVGSDVDETTLVGVWQGEQAPGWWLDALCVEECEQESIMQGGEVTAEGDVDGSTVVAVGHGQETLVSWLDVLRFESEQDALVQNDEAVIVSGVHESTIRRVRAMQASRLTALYLEEHEQDRLTRNDEVIARGVRVNVVVVHAAAGERLLTPVSQRERVIAASLDALRVEKIIAALLHAPRAKEWRRYALAPDDTAGGIKIIDGPSFSVFTTYPGATLGPDESRGGTILLLSALYERLYPLVLFFRRTIEASLLQVAVAGMSMRTPASLLTPQLPRFKRSPVEARRTRVGVIGDSSRGGGLARSSMSTSRIEAKTVPRLLYRELSQAAHLARPDREESPPPGIPKRASGGGPIRRVARPVRDAMVRLYRARSAMAVGKHGVRLVFLAVLRNALLVAPVLTVVGLVLSLGLVGLAIAMFLAPVAARLDSVIVICIVLLGMYGTVYAIRK